MKLIHDEQNLKKFIDLLVPNEYYYLCLHSRSKYGAAVDKKFCHRIVRGSDVYSTIQQMESLGSKDSGTTGLYITPNFLDQKKMWVAMGQQCFKALVTTPLDVESFLFTVVSQFVDNKYIILDIDKEILEEGFENNIVIQTKGGFHVLGKETKLLGSRSPGNLSPVPGCWQAGFVPKFLG